MATLTKHLLSQVDSISSRRFIVTSTEASAANVFHKTGTTSTTLDELWIYAHNYGAADTEVTFLMGLTGLPATVDGNVSESVAVTIPFKSGRALVFDGILMSHGLSAAAYASTSSSITLDGFVNRIAS